MWPHEHCESRRHGFCDTVAREELAFRAYGDTEGASDGVDDPGSVLRPLILFLAKETGWSLTEIQALPASEFAGYCAMLRYGKEVERAQIEKQTRQR